MQNVYKAELYRFSLIASTSLCVMLSTLTDAPPAKAALLLGALWLFLTACLLKSTPRWPLPIPWHCIPSLLLAILISIDPGRYAIWSWCWALLLILPQPRWTGIFHLGLALFGWWQFRDMVDTPSWFFYGLLLALLMLTGQSRAIQLRSLWENATQCDQLATGQRLWSPDSLADDIAREHARSDREGTHAELLLLRTARRQQNQAAAALWHCLAAFEQGYKIDQQTLAALLISRDLTHARQRREALLTALPDTARIRVIYLSQALPLEAEIQALETQQAPQYCTEEATRHG